MGRRINICFAGDSGVGKSSLLKRIQKGQFDEYMSVTLGVDHYIDKRIIDGVDTSVWLCDTGGQDRFRAMAPSYFRDADGIFLIFSLEKDESIRGLQIWMQVIDQIVSQQVPKILIGNKFDKISKISNEAQNFIKRIQKQRNYKFYQTSAKSGKNIMEAYQNLLSESSRFVKKQWTKSKGENEIKLSTSSILQRIKKCKCW